ncbi:MAG: hypothetical protein HKN59_03440 [Gammaproteobacteria bacterium]|nr:hypothetical protein [Gammaproteobacteria bacterium]
MSEDQARHNIYVAVVGEVPPVWRPVEALQVSADTYEIVSVNANPEGQQWQFETGAKVRVREHTFMDDSKGLVAEEKA